MTSLKAFLREPTWLTVDCWQNYKLREKEAINEASSSVAKQSVLIEMGFASLGGEGKNVSQEISRYLPFQLKGNDQAIDEFAVEIFWELLRAEKLSPYVQKAFKENKDLFSLLENNRQMPSDKTQ
jgi:hypothetical protein